MKNPVVLFAFPILVIGMLFSEWLEVARSKERKADMVEQVRREVLLAGEREQYVVAAVEQYPDLRDPDSRMRRMCIDRYSEMVRLHAPDLDRPDYPLVLANQAAQALGLSPIVTTKIP